jgi:hypothetical protein
MPIPPARILLAVLAASLALPIAGCGSDKKGAPIPTQEAQQLKSLLAETQRRMDARNACATVRSQDLPQLEAIVNRLPGSVDHNTRTTLNDGMNHLRDLVDQQCNQIRADKLKTQTTPTESQTTPTETTPTETTPTETTPTQTTPTQTTPTDTGNNGGATVPSPNGGGAKPGKAPKAPKD